MASSIRSAIHNVWAVVRPESTAVSLREKCYSALGVAIALLCSSLVTSFFVGNSGSAVLVASMGASTLLIFAFPVSPFAQPWPFVGGNLVSALVAIACVHGLPHTPWAQALTVGLAVLAMFALRCLHPPGGATALALTMGSAAAPLPEFHYLLVPLVINIAVVLACAFILNNVLPGRHYPARKSLPSPHLSTDPAPLQRAGITHADIEQALSEFPRPLDVSLEEVELLVELAEARAFSKRFPTLLCGDIMSRDVIAASPENDIDTTWALLKRHKVGALPVINADGSLLGLITVVDILSRGNFRRNQGVAASTTPDGEQERRTVRDVMATHVVSVKHIDHIVTLVPLLSDKGYHHVPVVDDRQHVVGMISQSDLIGALFRSR